MAAALTGVDTSHDGSTPAESCDCMMQDYVKAAGKQLGIDLQVGAFVRVQVGEGLEKAEKDFATEVAETVRGTS